MVERMLCDYQRAYGLNSVALRYFNASGADPEGELGELRDPETHLIPRAMMAIQGYIPDFAVFGTDYHTPDGTAIRDYIHVSDLADAHVAALRRLLGGRQEEPSILARVRATRSSEVLDAIAAETGESLNVRWRLRRDGDPACADRRRLFSSASSALRQIVRSKDHRAQRLGVASQGPPQREPIARAVSQSRHEQSAVQPEG